MRPVKNFCVGSRADIQLSNPEFIASNFQKCDLPFVLNSVTYESVGDFALLSNEKFIILIDTTIKKFLPTYFIPKSEIGGSDLTKFAEKAPFLVFTNSLPSLALGRVESISYNGYCIANIDNNWPPYSPRVGGEEFVLNIKLWGCFIDCPERYKRWSP